MGVVSAMTAKKLSPTGRLLRTSRLFSLPPPLPRPGAKIAAAQPESDTATLPHPTHAAIETNLSSLGRGDWGLKRPLPRGFKASSTTPMIRIGDIDSIDHITEFESAADYTMTLRKFQELNVPLSVAPPPRRTFNEDRKAQPPKTSVFEPTRDNTEKANWAENTARWKFEGPWLASKSEDEFQQYIKEKVQRRRSGFRKFLRSELKETLIEDRKRTAMHSGEDFEQVVEVSEKDITAFIGKIRQDRESLHRLIEKFLDLPTYETVSGQISTRNLSNKGRKATEYAFLEDGPPQTHPAAGLSYLRTASHIHNHPVLGPQVVEPPVQGRVLIPHGSLGGKNMRALVGVAGVVADDDQSRFYRKTTQRGILDFDPDISGGTKIWYHIENAYIDSRGRVNLCLKHASNDALAIYEGIVKPKEEDTVDESVISGGDRQFPQSFSRPSPAFEKRSRGGYGLEGTDNERRRGRAKDIPDVPQEDLLDLLQAGNAPNAPPRW